MGDIDVEAIRARVDAATPGPWETRIDRYNPVIVSMGSNWPRGDDDAYATVYRLADAKFMAAARQDIPDLLAELAHLRSVVAGVEALAEDGNSDIEDEIEEALERSHGANHYGCCFTPGIYAYGCTDAVKRRLRSVLSDTRQEQQA